MGFKFDKNSAKDIGVGTLMGGTTGGLLAPTVKRWTSKPEDLPLVGGLFPNKDAEEAARKAREALENLGTPDPESLKIQLQQMVSQGVLTPEQAETYFQESSAMQNITLDPRMKQAQMDALTSMQDIGQNKGLTAMDQAQLAQIASKEQAQQRGSREAILQNAQTRGMGGSGLEMMSQMQNQQDSATRQSQRDLGVAGMAQQRALDALQGAGSLGGRMQAQDFSQQAQQAQASDAINRFNASARQSTGDANTLARNQAAAANLSARQNLANQNVGLANQEQMHNKDLAQQDFENRYRKAGGVAGQYNKDSAAELAENERKQKIWGEMAAAGAKAYTGGGAV